MGTRSLPSEAGQGAGHLLPQLGPPSGVSPACIQALVGCCGRGPGHRRRGTGRNPGPSATKAHIAFQDKGPQAPQTQPAASQAAMTQNLYCMAPPSSESVESLGWWQGRGGVPPTALLSPWVGSGLSQLWSSAQAWGWPKLQGVTPQRQWGVSQCLLPGPGPRRGLCWALPATVLGAEGSGLHLALLPCAAASALRVEDGTETPLVPGTAVSPCQPQQPHFRLWAPQSPPQTPRAEPPRASLGATPASPQRAQGHRLATPRVGGRALGGLTFPQGHPACRAGRRQAAREGTSAAPATPALWISPLRGSPRLSPGWPNPAGPGSVNPLVPGGRHQPGALGCRQCRG